MKRIILLLIILGLFRHIALAQDHKEIDSLQNELRKYDVHKKELGSKVPSLMDTTKANILYQMVLLFYGGNADSATIYAEQLKSLSERIGYKKGIGNYYNGLGLINMVKGRNFQLAEASFQQALQIRTKIEDKEGVGWSYNNMGNMYGIEGNILEAIKCHSKALKTREEINDTVGIVESLCKRGREYGKVGNYTGALKDALYALKISNESGFKVGIIMSYEAIGQIYQLEGNYSEALKSYIASAKIYEKTGDVNGITNSDAIFGNIYLLKGDTVEALRKYYDALKIFQQYKNGYGNLQCDINIGNIYFCQGKYDNALKYLFDALSISEGLKEKNSISIVSVAIANVYNKIGKYHEALSYINTGLTNAQEIGYKDEIKNAYKTLSEIYAKLNNFKAAYQYQVLYQEEKDTVLNVENTSKMKQLDMQYYFDKDAVIQRAEQDKKDALREKEVETQRLRRNTIFFVLGIIVLFLIVVIILRNKIANERRQKALELERNRISRDLHDDLGSGLTKIAMMSQNAIKITGEQQQNALKKITNESSEMVEMMNVIIWAMNTTNDSLPNLLSFLKMSAFEMYEDAVIKLVWSTPEIIPETPVNGETRRNIYLVVKEALHNVWKYSEASQVIVTITILNDKLTIAIDDNGKGFDILADNKKGRGGNGLLNMKKRMEEVNGTFTISSEINKGTKVSICFSIKDYTKV